MATQSQQLAQSAAAMSLTNPGAYGAPGGMVATATAAITAQQAFVINAFRGQVYISDTLDVQDTPLYDTVSLNEGQTVQTGYNSNSAFFSDIGAASGKSIAQTNMTEAKQLPAPEAFSVFSVRITWQEWIYYLDLQNLLTDYEYEFWLGKKSYQQANLRHFSAGMGIQGFSTLTGFQALTNGSTDSRSMHTLDIKMVIANLQSFYGFLGGNTQYVLNASGTGLILLCELNGLYARGVQ